MRCSARSTLLVALTMNLLARMLWMQATVTVDQLLRMNSGLSDFEGGNGNPNFDYPTLVNGTAHPTVVHSPLESFEFVGQRGFVCKPGTCFSYVAVLLNTSSFDAAGIVGHAIRFGVEVPSRRGSVHYSSFFRFLMLTCCCIGRCCTHLCNNTGTRPAGLWLLG